MFEFCFCERIGEFFIGGDHFDHVNPGNRHVHGIVNRYPALHGNGNGQRDDRLRRLDYHRQCCDGTDNLIDLLMRQFPPALLFSQDVSRLGIDQIRCVEQ